MVSAISRTHEIERYSAQAFSIDDADEITEGWFMERVSGTTTSHAGTALPRAQAYSANGGTTVPVGVSTWTLEAYDSTADQTGQNRQKPRRYNPAITGEATMINRGSDIDAFDRVAPCVSGFQEATSGMLDVGFVYEDVAAGAEGRIRFDLTNTVTIA